MARATVKATRTRLRSLWLRIQKRTGLHTRCASSHAQSLQQTRAEVSQLHSSVERATGEQKRQNCSNVGHCWCVFECIPLVTGTVSSKKVADGRVEANNSAKTDGLGHFQYRAEEAELGPQARLSGELCSSLFRLTCGSGESRRAEKADSACDTRDHEYATVCTRWIKILCRSEGGTATERRRIKRRKRFVLACCGFDQLLGCPGGESSDDEKEDGASKSASEHVDLSSEMLCRSRSGKAEA